MMKSKNKDTDNEIFQSKKILTYSLLTIIFILTSFFSVYYIYSNFSDKSSFLKFHVTSPKILLYIIVLLLIAYVLDSVRFYYVLKTLDLKINFLHIFKINFISGFLSNITPCGIGGGISQLYYMNQEGLSIGDATAVATIKTVLPLAFLFLTTPIILLTNKTLLKLFPNGNNILYIFLLVLIYIIIVYFAYKLINNTKILKGFIYKIICFLQNIHLISNRKKKTLLKKFFTEIDKFASSIKRFVSGNNLYAFLSIFYMLIYLTIMFSFPAILMDGLGYKVSLLNVIPLQIVLYFITYLAPTPGATGIAEGGFSLLFSDYVSGKDILTVTFWWRFITLYLGMIIGLFLFYYDLGKRNLKTH